MDVLNGYNNEKAVIKINSPSSCLKSDVSFPFTQNYTKEWIQNAKTIIKCENDENYSNNLLSDLNSVKNSSLQLKIIHSGAVQVKRAELTQFFIFIGNSKEIQIPAVRT